jgi:hypothetical protein
LICGICILLCGISAANGATMAGTFTDSADGYNITVNYNRVANYSPGIDQLTFTIGTISDGTNNGKVNDLGGLAQQGGVYPGNANFTVLSPGAGTPVIYLDDADPNDMRGTPAPGSYVNLNLTNGESFVGNPLAMYQDGSLINGYSGFADTWFTTTGSRQLGAGGTLAVMYVSANAGVTCTGELITTTEGGNGYLGSFTAAAVGTPEPSTLALLASGLVGLLAYAW